MPTCPGFTCGFAGKVWVREVAEGAGDFTIEVDQEGKYLLFHPGEEVYGVSIADVTEIVEIRQVTEVPDLPDYVKVLSTCGEE